MNALNDTKEFDLDLKFGKFGEGWCLALGSEGRMEVKTDRKWCDTGNLFFEIESRGVKSGIATSTAKFWAQVMHYQGQNLGVMVFQTEMLRKNLRAMVGDKSARITRGGDDCTSKGVIIPMFQAMRLYSPKP